MGATSAFSFGQQYEKILMALTCLKIPFETVRPTEWQKYLGVNKKHEKKADHKEYLRQKAMEMYPAVFDGHNKTYGKAVCDAVLLMEYGRRKKVDAVANI